MSIKNPYANPEKNPNEKLDKQKVNNIISNSSVGAGTMSSTISQNHIGFVQGPNWIGEESLILDYPVIYSAIATSDNVRVLKVANNDLKTKLPPDILKQIEKNLWPRL